MAGGVISTGAHPKSLWPGVHDFWGQVYAEHKTEYPDLYDVLDSEMAYEEDVQVTGFGLAPVKPEGDSLSYDYEIQGPVQRYTHIAYALGYKVTFEELRDNLYEKVSMRRAQANAFSVAQTIENVAAAVYNDAFTGNVFTYGDGLSLCNTAHTNTTGGTFSNALSPGADLARPRSKTSVSKRCRYCLTADFSSRSCRCPCISPLTSGSTHIVSSRAFSRTIPLTTRSTSSRRRTRCPTGSR